MNVSVLINFYFEGWFIVLIIFLFSFISCLLNKYLVHDFFLFHFKRIFHWTCLMKWKKEKKKYVHMKEKL